MTSFDRTFILTTTDRHLELLKLDTGEVCFHGPSLLTWSDAHQVSIGFQAILSGQFDRACSEETLRFDLARRNPARSRSDSATVTSQPSLGDL